ncbi:MAG: hypothetical protein E6686_10080 [Lachnospiraceae bacterium]|nr:hypothetical protein [Lachnospiraceae bacterium]
MMYGVKYEKDEIKIEKGSLAELEQQGYTICESEKHAKVTGKNLEYKALRKEFNSLTIEQLDSSYALLLEKKIWGEFVQDEDYIPGKHINERKKKLCSI